MQVMIILLTRVFKQSQEHDVRVIGATNTTEMKCAYWHREDQRDRMFCALLMFVRLGTYIYAYTHMHICIIAHMYTLCMCMYSHIDIYSHTYIILLAYIYNIVSLQNENILTRCNLCASTFSPEYLEGENRLEN